MSLRWKIHKCTNWPLIAEACITILGAQLYVGGGNINRKTLAELAGFVVVLFGDGGYKALMAQHGVVHPGILRFANLAKKDETTGAKGAYRPDYDGLQYYGNFGDTAMKTTREKKLQANAKKQTQFMSDARLAPPDVLRMMYWTTTGLKENIQDRDQAMWRPPNLRGFMEAWNAGMGASVSAHARQPLGGPGMTNTFVGNEIKTYMPNIIMIDFAERSKTTLIYNLTRVAAGQISADESYIGQLVSVLG